MGNTEQAVPCLPRRGNGGLGTFEEHFEGLEMAAGGSHGNVASGCVSVVRTFNAVSSLGAG